MELAARLGLTARGVLYLLLGVLVFALALGDKQSETDQRGALQALSSHTGGAILLLLIALGFAGYALWRFTEAAFGAAGDGKRAGPRVQSLFRGLAYTFLAGTAFAVLSGRNRSQGAQSSELSARVMSHDGGRLLVFAVGAVIAVVGAVLVVQGFRRSFVQYLRLDGLREQLRSIVIALGVVGTVARGAVFALTGALVIDAAVRYDPRQAAGIDSAIRTLAGADLGHLLLLATGAGLVAFGSYGLAEARWRVT